MTQEVFHFYSPAPSAVRPLPRAITAKEIAIVRDAAHFLANRGPQPNLVRLHDLAAQWRAIVPSGRDAGTRVCEAYVQMYPALEAEGGIDGWGGSESRSVLTHLLLTFPAESDRWEAVREALDVEWMTEPDSGD